jgi:hypothetical protein
MPSRIFEWKPYPLAGQGFFVCRRTGGCPLHHPGNIPSNVLETSGQWPGNVPAIPTPLERVVMPAAK